jgi:hypothetical protein
MAEIPDKVEVEPPIEDFGSGLASGGLVLPERFYIVGENGADGVIVQEIPPTTSSTITKLYTVPICPDHLSYEDFGVADCRRGRVIRAFFWLLRFWP